jgi:dienelactone hydrolase
MALELARAGADLKAIVGSSLAAWAKPADSWQHTGIVLMCCSADDPIVTSEQRLGFEAEMREPRAADRRIEVYGGVGHPFTNPA